MAIWGQTQLGGSGESMLGEEGRNRRIENQNLVKQDVNDMSLSSVKQSVSHFTPSNKFSSSLSAMFSDLEYLYCSGDHLANHAMGYAPAMKIFPARHRTALV